MPLRRPQLLRRLHLEIRDAPSVCLLGLEVEELERAIGPRRSWHRWPERGQAAPHTVAVVCEVVSEHGDLLPSVAAIRQAEQLRRPVPRLVSMASRTVAILAGAPHGDGGPGRPALAARCEGPQAVRQAADRVLSPWATFDVAPAGLLLRELCPELCARKLQEMVDVPLKVASDLAEIGWDAAGAGPRDAPR